jgi:hypothetical protein
MSVPTEDAAMIGTSFLLEFLTMFNIGSFLSAWLFHNHFILFDFVSFREKPNRGLSL